MKEAISITWEFVQVHWVWSTVITVVWVAIWTLPFRKKRLWFGCESVEEWIDPWVEPHVHQRWACSESFHYIFSLVNVLYALRSQSLRRCRNCRSGFLKRMR